MKTPTPPLSPAAQAVMDAVNNAPLYQDIAAALVAAADQVIPEEDVENADYHCLHEKWAAQGKQEARDELLALATELRQEGQP